MISDESKKFDELVENVELQRPTSLVRLKKELYGIEDKAILNSSLGLDKKIFLLKTKHGSSFFDDLVVDRKVIYYKDYKLINFSKERLHLDFITQSRGDKYTLEGYVTRNPFWELVTVELRKDGDKIPIEPAERARRQRRFGNFLFDSGGAFTVDVKLPQERAHKLSFVVTIGGHEFTLRLLMGPHARLGNILGSYRRDQSCLLVRGAKSIAIRPYSKLRHAIYELRFLFSLLFNWQIRHVTGRAIRLYRSGQLSIRQPKRLVKEIITSIGMVAEAVAMIPRAILLRTVYYIAKPRVKKPIWLVSDRAVAAGDNGEALFRYIVKQQDCPADVYFVISRTAKDYDRMSQYGQVLAQESLKYKLKFLMADKIISSQANIETNNPFIRQRDHFVDLYNFDFVFLQHGVIRHDHTSWLDRYTKNFRLFITSAEKEYNSILEKPYYYPKENVLLSGQPRYDYLENNPNKKLVLVPTYRKRLALKKTDKKGLRKYDPEFKKTEYRKFYNDFMNDSRIIAELKNQGMTGDFYLHPVFEAQQRDFDENDVFKAVAYPYNYKDAFSEGELLVSDHSSVVFDFAYMKKPTVYAHFDADTFFEGHSYSKSDFFDDENDGFGEVYYDYEGLVEGVLKLLRNGRKMSVKYQKRVDDFFYKTDRNNSRRVYEAIRAIGSREVK